MRPTPGVEIYREHPRSYRSTVALGVAIAAGAIADYVLGGGGAHFWAWLAAFVLICGFDALAVAASQRLRSIAITRDQLVVGEHSFDRAQIDGVDVPADVGVAAIAPSPRGSTLVGVRVKGGGVLGVPTRKPEQLAGALGFRATPVLLEVRPAEPADLGGLPELETRSDTVFSVAGFPPLPPAADVATYAASAALFVAGRPPVGLARVELVDGTPHLEQLSVLPSHMRRGVGTALLDRVVTWAAENGHSAVTLCTFGDVAWNGPFYARHGFVEVPSEQWTPGLVALRAEENEHGMDVMGRRVVMRRALTPSE
ncbi:GNAT family N-acetyltransferase [Jatrophihabitans sp. YIM 134969]